jgi:hypothetical protein
MKKALKITAFVFLGLILVAIVGATYVKTALPDVGDAPQLSIEKTSARI